MCNPVQKQTYIKISGGQVQSKFKVIKRRNFDQGAKNKRISVFDDFRPKDKYPLKEIGLNESIAVDVGQAYQTT